MFYLWLLGWQALLYLPRLFVYHADKTKDKITSDTFKVMEHRLYYYIGTPSAVAVWITGLYLAYKLEFTDG